MAEIVAMRRDEGRVQVAIDGGVMQVTLASPPANALSLEVIGLLQDALDAARADDAVRVVVIGAVGKVFSGGHDLKEMTAARTDPDRGKAFFQTTFERCAAMMQSIVGLPKPVIARVDGIATAAGCQFVASCDLAIASDRATFGVNGIDVGLFCTTPGVALARGLKPKHAMEMLLTGEMIDASAAREFGLINRVVPSEYLNQVVSKYAQAIAAKSPSAIRFGKQAFYRQREMSLADAYAYASGIIVDNMMHADACEGIDAFITKRTPRWEQP